MSTTMPQVAAHTASVAAILGTLANILPPVLAALGSLLAVIWYGVQIYESKTAQAWRARWHRGKQV